MKVSNLNPDLLVVCHCYSGDRQQVLDLLDVYEHHEAPVVIVSPTDSPVHNVGPHHTRVAGEVAYIGQKSWDRQHAQLELLLEYPQKWFLLNDSDSFYVTPKLPAYLFERDDTVYSNQVNDFRIPGQRYVDATNDVTWPVDYHKGYPLLAMQPPYFLHRNALEKIVKASKGLVACPITPFIDWWWIPAVYAAGVRHEGFRNCASCETVTANGIAVMSECVSLRGAEALHSIKSGAVKNLMLSLHRSRVRSLEAHQHPHI